jgi:hypothetical protein
VEHGRLATHADSFAKLPAGVATLRAGLGAPLGRSTAQNLSTRAGSAWFSTARSRSGRGVAGAATLDP